MKLLNIDRNYFADQEQNCVFEVVQRKMLYKNSEEIQKSNMFFSSLFILIVAFILLIYFKMKNHLDKKNRIYLETELERKTSEIKAKEEIFKIYTEKNPDVIIQTDKYHTINYVSPSIKSNLGYEREALIGKNFLDILKCHTDISADDYIKFLHVDDYSNFKLKTVNSESISTHFDVYVIKSNSNNINNNYQFIGRNITGKINSEKRFERISEFRKELLVSTAQILELNENNTPFDDLMEKAIKFVDKAEKGTLMLKDDKDIYHIVASHGYDNHILRGISFSEAELFDCNSKAPKILKSFNRETQLSRKQHDDLIKSGFSNVKSIISAPIVLNGEIIARLTMDNFTDEEAFNQEDVETVSLLGQQLAIFLEKKRSEAAILMEKEKLYHQAMFDFLTNTPNRRYAETHFNEVLKKTKNTPKKIAVMYTNIKRFRELNSTYGRFTCDQLLIDTAQSLKSILKKDDFLARFEGDEFVMLLLFEDKGKLLDQIDRIKSELEKPFSVNTETISLKFRTGVSVAPDDSEKFDTLLKFASTAATLNEKSQTDITFFKKIQLDILSERTILEQKLYNDLQNHRENFSLRFHPCINIGDNSVDHLEALLRWQIDGNFVSPEKFISIAEETNLINRIGEMVIEKTLQQMQEWKKLNINIPVSINLSARDLSRPDIIDLLAAALKRYNIAGKCFGIELTERALVEDPERVSRKFRKIKEMGVTISIDDFGTGYSSLSCLSNYPIDFIKIDKCFVDRMLQSNSHQSIINAIISLSRAIDAKTIAEGVEIEEQHDILKQYNCDMIQGFYYYKPLKGEEITDLFAS